MNILEYKEGVANVINSKGLKGFVRPNDDSYNELAEKIGGIYCYDTKTGTHGILVLYILNFPAKRYVDSETFILGNPKNKDINLDPLLKSKDYIIIHDFYDESSFYYIEDAIKYVISQLNVTALQQAI
jgi:hypothetical protein